LPATVAAEGGNSLLLIEDDDVCQVRGPAGLFGVLFQNHVVVSKEGIRRDRGDAPRHSETPSLYLLSDAPGETPSHKQYDDRHEHEEHGAGGHHEPSLELQLDGKQGHCSPLPHGRPGLAFTQIERFLATSAQLSPSGHQIPPLKKGDAGGFPGALQFPPAPLCKRGEWHPWSPSAHPGSIAYLTSGKLDPAQSHPADGWQRQRTDCALSGRKWQT
jgi:hypothetical protein